MAGIKKPACARCAARAAASDCALDPLKYMLVENQGRASFALARNFADIKLAYSKNPEALCKFLSSFRGIYHLNNNTGVGRKSRIPSLSP